MRSKREADLGWKGEVSGGVRVRKPILAIGLACLMLAACQRSADGRAAQACALPGDALMARALLDQANAALAHADARSAVASLDAGLTRIGEPDLAAPTMPLDDTGMKIEAVRGQGDPGRLAKLEQRILAERLADYDRYCGH
jgi:hypothetical protein